LLQGIASTGAKWPGQHFIFEVEKPPGCAAVITVREDTNHGGVRLHGGLFWILTNYKNNKVREDKNLGERMRKTSRLNSLI